MGIIFRQNSKLEAKGRQSKGASLAEFGILAGLVTVTCIGAVSGFGKEVREMLGGVAISGHLPIASGNEPPTVGSGPIPEPTCADEYSYTTNLTYYFQINNLQTSVSNNIWNPQNNGTAENPEFVCLDVADNPVEPTSSVPWAWNWNVPGNASAVVAYPEITFGQKPWDGYDPAPSSDLILARDVELTYAYNKTDVQGIYNVAASMWVNDSATSLPDNVVAEVMVWVENAGHYPAGSIVASNVSIDGKTYDLWYEPNMVDASGTHSNTWEYFAFESQSTQTSGTLSSQAFMQYLVDEGYLLSSHYMASIEIGSEIVEGSGTIAFTTASVSGMTGYGSDPDESPVSAFSFPATTVSAATSATEITSDYIDIEGLNNPPRPFTVTESNGSLNPLAVTNVVGGTPSASGMVQWGTALQIDTPAAGETVTVTLDVDGVQGTWTVIREASAPEFALTGGDGLNWHQIMYADLGIPLDNYAYTLTSTGTLNAYVVADWIETGTSTDGTTVNYGIQIENAWPEAGQTETITLVIGGQTLEWDVVSPE